MTSLLDRQHRLLEFLHAALPGFRIVRTVASPDDFLRHGRTSHPEIRLRPSATTPDGLLAWEVAILPGLDLAEDQRLRGTHGLLPAIDAVTRAIRRRDAEPAYRLRLGAGIIASPGGEGVRLYIEEGWEAPPGFAVFARADEVAWAGPSAIPGNTNTFPEIAIVGAPPEVGDSFIITDASGTTFLGEAVATEPVLTTEFPTRRPHDSMAVLYKVTSGIRLPVPVTLSRKLNAEEAWRHFTTLDGRHRLALVAPERHLTRLSLPLVAESTRHAIERSMTEQRDKASMILIQPDFEAVEATVSAIEYVDHPDHRCGSLQIEISTRTLTDMTPFVEEEP